MPTEGAAIHALAVELLAVAFPYVLPTARAVGIMIFLPGIGATHVPPQIRMILGGSLAFLVVGTIDVSTPVPEGFAPLIAALLSELALGLVVGWVMTVFFESVRWGGEIVDMQIGLRAGQFFDPVMSHGSSLLGQVYHLTTVTFFFVIDGHHWVLAAVARSFERIAPGELAFGTSVVHLLVGAASSGLDIGVRIAAAGVAALLLADIALAIVGRHVPQMNVFLVGIPGKLGAGLAVLAFTAPLLGGAIGALVTQIKQYALVLLGG